MGNAGKPSEAEIADRLPLWAALSALFLDTEHDQTSLARSAESIAATGCGAREAAKVLDHDVAPALYPNLLSVAGEWTFWTDDEVRAAVMQHLGRGTLRRWMARARACTVRQAYASDWKAIAAMLDQEASLSCTERDRTKPTL